MDRGNMKFEMMDEWVERRSFPRLMELREAFYREREGEEGCTCDMCPLVAVCALAFDGYNTGGDCLYSK